MKGDSTHCRAGNAAVSVYSFCFCESFVEVTVKSVACEVTATESVSTCAGFGSWTSFSLASATGVIWRCEVSVVNETAGFFLQRRLD